MMITINLLPPEFRRKVERPHTVSLRFVMILVCFLSLILWGALAFMTGTAKSEEQNLKTDWVRLNAGAAEADKIMLDINKNFVEQKKIADAILSTDISWSKVLNQISETLPNSAWLNKVMLQSGGINDWELTVKGIVTNSSNKTPLIKLVGEYISTLKQSLEKLMKENMPSKQVTGVEPEVNINVETSTERELIDGKEVISFESRFTLKGENDEGVRNKR